MAKTIHSRQTYAASPKHAAYLRSQSQGPGRTTPARAVAHIEFLTSMGLSLHSIARDAGIHSDTIYRLHTWTKLSESITRAILAVDWHPNARQETVLAVGAARRLQALNVIGWSFAELANRIGVSLSRAHLIATRNQTTIIWSHWKNIHDLYETLSGTPGPSKRAAAGARRRGWPAPLDWEGHDIDDPRVIVQAQPWKPKSAKEIAAERALVVAELTAKGLSAKEVADRVGVTPRQVVRDRGATSIAAA